VFTKERESFDEFGFAPDKRRQIRRQLGIRGRPAGSADPSLACPPTVCNAFELRLRVRRELQRRH
jgi:hypothetical protein